MTVWWKGRRIDTRQSVIVTYLFGQNEMNCARVTVSSNLNELVLCPNFLNSISFLPSFLLTGWIGRSMIIMLQIINFVSDRCRVIYLRLWSADLHTDAKISHFSLEFIVMMLSAPSGQPQLLFNPVLIDLTQTVGDFCNDCCLSVSPHTLRP